MVMYEAKQNDPQGVFKKFDPNADIHLKSMHLYINAVTE